VTQEIEFASVFEIISLLQQTQEDCWTGYYWGQSCSTDVLIRQFFPTAVAAVQ